MSDVRVHVPMYVLLGHVTHPYSLTSHTTVVLATSGGEAALERFARSLRAGDGVYAYEGQEFSSVDVVGPVPLIG